ncbi:MAG: dihydrolipoamide acetyltransferase family protein [Bacteroidota bacterium]|jgi:2-oxoglutarate dehydrogenase E2 component (dihydrolipoamide succinyltransferase)
MQVEIIMPKMGESIFEGTIIRWAKKLGERIEKDETILEISTDKVDSEIPSPAQGILTKILVEEQQTVPVGTVIAYIETDPSANIKITTHTETEITTKEYSEDASVPESNTYSTAHNQKQDRQRFYSPLVKMIAKKDGVEQNALDKIAGSGSNGRVTKFDILNYLTHRTDNTKNYSTRAIDISELSKKYPEPNYRLVRMDNVQKKMAEHMVRSVSTSPHVTIIDEVDLTEIMNYRLRILEEFEKRAGFKLTYMPFFAYAVVSALKEFSIVNSSLEGDVIIYKNSINLGIAVAAPNGLIVPVVHHAEKMDFISLARALTDVAVRARTKKLSPDDIVNGTFSITNYGIFGSIIGTPIINQPQAAILGIGAIKKRPIVLSDDDGKDSIEIRSMTYLTLTFDHRIIDGAIGGKFLSRVKWYLEHFDFHLVK